MKGMIRLKSSQISIILISEVTGKLATTEMYMLTKTSITVMFTAMADSK